jgi:hypothetical protein
MLDRGNMLDEIELMKYYCLEKKEIMKYYHLYI